MKTRIWVMVGGLLVLPGWTRPLNAQDKIQSFMTEGGKVVFTNLVDNTPPPAATVPSSAIASAVAADDAFTREVHSLIDSISSNHGVDPALVKAVVQTESNYNRFAVSSKGALGLMQLIRSTGARFGVEDFFDPKQNLEGGIRYLKFLLEKFNGDLDLSLAAYNAGENLVERLGRIPSIPETRDYVRKVRSIYGEPKSAGAQKLAPAPGVAPAGATIKDEPPRIYRQVDERGITHFSNIDPPR